MDLLISPVFQILTFETLKCNYSNEGYWATAEQYFPVVLFIMLYKMALTLSLF